MRLSWLIFGCALAYGCGLNNEGIDPPLERLYFPNALELSPQQCETGPCYLFVTNSNFDLRYNRGSLHSIDLEQVYSAVQACDAPPCEFSDYGEFIAGEVFMGSFAADIVVAPAGDRLYVPVRSNSTLTFVDVAPDGTLNCGGSGSRHTCDSDYRRGRSTASNVRNLEMPRDPVAAVGGSLETDFGGSPGSGNYVLVGHSGGSVSFFLEQLEGDGAGTAPTLVDVENGFPDGLTGIGFDAAEQRIYTTSRSLSQLALGGVAFDQSLIERSFVFAANSLTYTGLDDGSDTRGVLLDPFRRRLYVLARRPEALLFVDLDQANAPADEVPLSNIIRLGPGPARIVRGYFPARDRLFLFISCFDAGSVYVVDVEFEQLSSVIAGYNGPFAMAVDVPRELLYVADFRSSVISVVDLRPLATGGAPYELAVLGAERPVKELQ